MNWVEHAIWWHVYPLGFVGAPIRDVNWDEDASPRLRQLVNWLDYAVELGVSGLLLGPIFASSTHGYDSLDQFRIDPRLGTLEDFDYLVAECRSRGLRILLDGVFSHVGSDHPELRQVLEAGAGSPKSDLFDVDWDAPGGPKPRVFEGHGALVRLNHASLATRSYVSDVMRYWLDRGIDGWRLDAAYSVAPWFWAQVIPPLRDEFPESWFLGEVIHGDYTAFVEESKVDSVTQYELWKAIWSSLLDENLFELEWSLQRHNDFLSHFVPNTFVGNHDVSRIASTLGLDRAVIAFAILMTVGGIPSVYYGDEQGFTGIKEQTATGDDAVRPPMPLNPQDLLPFGQPVLVQYRELIGIRRRHPWLVTAKTETVLVENKRLIYKTTEPNGSRSIRTEIDLGGLQRVRITDGNGEELWSWSEG